MVKQEPQELFDQEIKTFEKNREMLCSENYGKYVLIKSSKIEGMFDTIKDAVTAGKMKYGTKNPFFVKQILDKDVVNNFKLI